MNILVRDMPDGVHQKIREFATRQNISVNQVLLRMIREEMDRWQREKKEKEHREKAFQRIQKRREEIRRKYGLQEDSTKMIREFRDSR